MDTEKLEDFQKRVKRDRKRYDKIVAWHLQAFSTAGLNLPYTPDSTYISVDFKNPVYEDYKKPVPTDDNPDAWEYCWDTTVDEDKIVEYLSKVAKFARSQGYKVEKDYDSNFSIKVTLPGAADDAHDSDIDREVVINYYCDREAVCVKKVVGTKVVPAYTQPERIEEIVEWDCVKIAFTA